MSNLNLALEDRVRSQRTAIPSLYGNVDFDRAPFRFTADPDVRSSLPDWVADRGPLLVDHALVDVMRTATMLGDTVADPYAALASEHGVRTLAGWLREACRHGIDAVPDAPPELRALIEAMEDTPAWLDMVLVEEGARQSRVAAAFLSPFLIRGAFLATFMNSYAALPMALTGALSGRGAAHRINDTASFFTVTTLPGALDRHGPGFEAAAMVRLMHSVVRWNALTHPKRWDRDVYGIPVPQIDQVPAGLINIYLLAVGVLGKGRREFDERERAMVEFSRYRCWLLGLPEELLPTDPAGIVEVMHARAACLRDGFDETCQRLIDASMQAYLRPGRTRFDRAAEAVERSWSTLFILRFRRGDKDLASTIGLRFNLADKARIAATAPFIVGRYALVFTASRRAWSAKLVDPYVVRVAERRLATYGNPAHTTDPKSYDASSPEAGS